MAENKERGGIKMIGRFGSFVRQADEGGVAVGTDLVDLIYEQEKLRYPDFTVLKDRNKFGLVNFNLTAPSGTTLMLNNSEYCKVVITDTKQLVIPVDFFVVTSCILLSDCSSVNCRYLY